MGFFHTLRKETAYEGRGSWKLLALSGLAAVLLCVCVGIISRIALPVVLLRATFGGTGFVLLVLGIRLVVMRFLPELCQRDEPVLGTQTDVVLPEENPYEGEEGKEELQPHREGSDLATEKTGARKDDSIKDFLEGRDPAEMAMAVKTVIKRDGER